MQETVQPNGSVALEKNTFETYLLHIILEHKPEDHIVWVICIANSISPPQ